MTKLPHREEKEEAEMLSRLDNVLEFATLIETKTVQKIHERKITTKRYRILERDWYHLTGKYRERLLRGVVKDLTASFYNDTFKHLSFSIEEVENLPVTGVREYKEKFANDPIKKLIDRYYDGDIPVLRERMSPHLKKIRQDMVEEIARERKREEKEEVANIGGISIAGWSYFIVQAIDHYRLKQVIDLSSYVNLAGTRTISITDWRCIMFDNEDFDILRKLRHDDVLDYVKVYDNGYYADSGSYVGCVHFRVTDEMNNHKLWYDFCKNDDKEE